MATFNKEPAPQEFNWTIQWKTWLSRQFDKLASYFDSPTFGDVEVTGDVSIEGDLYSTGAIQTEEDISAQDAAFSGEVNVGGDVGVGGNLHVTGQIIRGPVDTTNLSSDYELVPGECAKITISAASTPLNIACEDGVYEIRAVFDFTTFAADSSFRILINNAAQTGAVTRIRLRAATDIATDEVDVAATAVDSHFDIISTRIVQVAGTITIMGAVSTAIGSIWGVNVGNVEQISVGCTHWAGTHTSLGTISLDEAATGICYVKRIA